MLILPRLPTQAGESPRCEYPLLVFLKQIPNPLDLVRDFHEFPQPELFDECQDSQGHCLPDFWKVL